MATHLPYRLASQFVVRLAGGALEELDGQQTPRTMAQARRVIEAENAVETAARQATAALQKRPDALDPKLLVVVRNKLGRRQQIDATAAAALSELLGYREAIGRRDDAEASLARTLDEELPAARRLSPGARELIRQFLVFAGGGVKDFGDKLFHDDAAPLPPRTGHVRQREQAALLYLQRICAKNDTISAFGPTCWGVVDGAAAGMRADPEPGIARRQVFLEKWVAVGLAAAMNRDPDVALELAPRLHPFARIEDHVIVRDDTGSTIALSDADLAFLRSCTGDLPAYRLDAADLSRLHVLRDAGVVRWEVEPITFGVERTEFLLADVRAWRDGPARRRWQPRLEELLAGVSRFAQERDAAQRNVLMDAAAQNVLAAGVPLPDSSRELYSGGNVISEECARAGRVVIGGDVADQLLADAAPWLEAFRDSYAFCASRVNVALRALWESAPRRNDVVSLPSFLRHCEQNGVSLTGGGITALASHAFGDVKAAFAAVVADKPADVHEWHLTADECRFVRRQFAFDPLDEFSFPAPDIQMIAKDWDAVSRGDYQILLAEIHAGAFTPIIHTIFWACPDKELFARDYQSNTKGERACYWGTLQGQDKTTHNHVHWFDAMGDRWTSVAGSRVRPGWPSVRPADAEVYLEPTRNDVRIRSRVSGQDLGSFARSGAIAFGVHPFFFGRDGHLPRLRIGRVILQRELWTVSHEELSGGPYQGTSARLAVAVERLRAAKGLPRRVFVRPTARALASKGVTGRDKDLKPIYIDLESYPLQEILYRWLSKHGELEVTEMLPTPEETPWIEADGRRRNFELRMSVRAR